MEATGSSQMSPPTCHINSSDHKLDTLRGQLSGSKHIRTDWIPWN